MCVIPDGAGRRRAPKLRGCMVQSVVKLTLLGGFELRLADGEVIDLPGQKDRALLAFLAISAGTGQARDKLSNLLWGDHGDAQARDSLKHALTRLRQKLEPTGVPAIFADRQVVRLDPAALSRRCRAFRSALAQRNSAIAPSGSRRVPGRPVGRFHNPQRAVRGLASGRAPAAPAQVRSGFEPADRRVDQSRLSDAAADAARLLLGRDPLQETACRSLMQFHASRGQTVQALKLYDELCARLREQHGSGA